MSVAEQLLIVEDEKLIRWSLKSRLEEDGLSVREAETGAEAIEQLSGSDFDLVILDHRLPDTTGLLILERIRQDWPDTMVVMMTAYGTVEDAVHAMKLGAIDYLTKPVNLDELALIVRKALDTGRLRREVQHLRRERRQMHGESEIVGSSDAMREVLRLVDKVCASQAATILLEGESGTGKNVVAKAIHYGSPRAERPFVTITCSALPETLLESELFGHERGAFTDAKSMKRGLLEVADGGTVFLDEIGEIGLPMQVKLLRFLEEKTFKRVGGTRDIRVDVRIIAATNRDLADAVRAGEFREDLYYRLRVIPIRLPALRERSEDVVPLARYFVDHFNRELRKETLGLTPDAERLLVAYDWPGNIRELRNVIERIMILETADRIEARYLPAAIRDHEAVPRIAAPPAPASGGATLRDMEREAIRAALDQVGNNQVRAARLLGVSRDTLRYRMKKFGLLAR
jgi:DNA-binding NtrC family response regulator